jgi:adenylosuccinate synthase
MAKIKAVIGANYGDEGKGLMTDYFANEAMISDHNCIVVCHNGGPQRGHTVITPEGIRHVFHHFGSGTFAGADTFLSEDYMVNPMIFKKEFYGLNKKVKINCFIDEKCKLTFPYDMMINQIIENRRGNARHGSCGMGIWETFVRNSHSYEYKIKDFIRDPYSILAFMEFLAKEYVPLRFKELGLDQLSIDEWNLINNKNIIANYFDDLLYMLSLVNITSSYILNNYSNIIFESGQGLLLDEKYSNGDILHVTASNTGLENPINIIRKTSGLVINSFEACYVTRTYMTRHGTGPFLSECFKENINSSMIDITNVPNEYQGSLRYGKIINSQLIERINKDSKFGINEFKDSNKFFISLAVTHLNEYNHDINFIGTRYNSDGITRDFIKKIDR